MIHNLSGVQPLVYIKIDMGTHRAGILPDSAFASTLISSILETEVAGYAILTGLYAHAGHSYSGSSCATALDYLRQEFEALLVVAETVRSISPSKSLILSVGATPTTTSIRNLLIQTNDEDEANAISALKGTIQSIRDQECKVEVHAGVYPVLDVQQLATHALRSAGPDAMRTWADLGFTIVAEVVSLYYSRGKDGTNEALINAGSLSMGREPCKAYPGWGIVSPWNISGASEPQSGPEGYKGWQVGRISQEHGILTWAGEPGKEDKLEIGQKIRIWPNQ
jgi:D-serine deaminase-like pyridoxal phosphate-dependent protein